MDTPDVAVIAVHTDDRLGIRTVKVMCPHCGNIHIHDCPRHPKRPPNRGYNILNPNHPNQTGGTSHHDHDTRTSCHTR